MKLTKLTFDTPGAAEAFVEGLKANDRMLNRRPAEEGPLRETTVDILVWVHSNADTGEPMEIDVSEVDGHVPVRWIGELVEHDDFTAEFCEMAAPTLDLDCWQWWTVTLYWEDGMEEYGEPGTPWFHSLKPAVIADA